MLKTCLVRQGLEEDGDEGVKVWMDGWMNSTVIDVLLDSFDVTTIFVPYKYNARKEDRKKL